MRHLIAVFVLGLFASPAAAQFAEGPVLVGYELHGAARGSGLPEAGRGRTTASVQVFRVSAGFPLQTEDRRLVVLPVLSYLQLNPDIEEADGPTLGALHAAMLTVAARYRFDDRWSALVLLGGGYTTDFDPGWSEDVVVTAAAIGSYAFNDDFSLGGGIGYDRRTGEVSPLPLVRLDWHFTERLRLSGVVPARLYLGWRAAEALTVGLRGGLEGDRFDLDGAAFGADQVQLAWSVVKLAPSVVWHIAPMMHLDVHAGLTTRRRFEVFVDDAPFGEGGLDGSWFVGARLWLGPSGWRRDAP